MRYVTYQNVVNGDMSGNITSSQVPMLTEVMISFQAVFTGAPVGTFKLQVSNTGSNWDDYAGSSQAISAAGTFTWDVVSTSVKFIRLVYTFTSGTGVLNVYAIGKGA